MNINNNPFIASACSLFGTASNAGDCTDALVTYGNALSWFLNTEEMAKSKVAAKSLNTAWKASRLRKQQSAMTQNATPKRPSKSQILRLAKAGSAYVQPREKPVTESISQEKLQEYAMYCFLLETIRLGAGVLSNQIVEWVSQTANVVGYSFLLRAETLAEPQEAPSIATTIKSRLRMLQAAASLLSCMVALTATMPPEPVPEMEMLKTGTTLAAASLGVINSAISLYDSREKIGSLTRTIFSKSSQLFGSFCRAS